MPTIKKKICSHVKVCEIGIVFLCFCTTKPIGTFWWGSTGANFTNRLKLSQLLFVVDLSPTKIELSLLVKSTAGQLRYLTWRSVSLSFFIIIEVEKEPPAQPPLMSRLQAVVWPLECKNQQKWPILQVKCKAIALLLHNISLFFALSWLRSATHG